MGRAELSITGIPLKVPYVRQDGIVELLLKIEMSDSLPKGLNPLGESIYKVFIAPKTWEKVCSDIKKDSFYIIRGEPKSSITPEKAPYIIVNATNVMLKEDNLTTIGKERPTIEPPAPVLAPTPKPQKNNQIPRAWFRYDDVIDNLVEVPTKDIKLIYDDHKFSVPFHKGVSSAKLINPVAIKPQDDGLFALLVGFVSFVNAKVFDIPTLKAYIWEGTREELISKYKIWG